MGSDADRAAATVHRTNRSHVSQIHQVDQEGAGPRGQPAIAKYRIGVFLMRASSLFFRTPSTSKFDA